MNELILKLLDQTTLELILEIVLLLLFLMGRITKSQLIVEQLKAKKIIAAVDAKKIAVEKAATPLTFVFDALDQIPIVNVKLPIINASLPQIAKSIVHFPFGIANDILFNLPIFGNKAK